MYLIKIIKIITFSIVIILRSNLIGNFYPLISKNISKITYDIVNINKNLIKKDTLNILALATPFYLTSLIFDKNISSIFYGKKDHKNVNYLPYYSSYLQISNILLSGSIICCLSCLLSNDKKFRLTNYELLLGLPLIGISKSLIKLIKWNGSLRPPNQYFIKDKKYYGGFPSGHLTTMSYISTIWIKQYGIKTTSPFLLISGYMFLDYIMQNRHYTSQLIAGITLGSIFGLAVSSLIDDKILSKSNLKLKSEDLDLKLIYKF